MNEKLTWKYTFEFEKYEFKVVLAFDMSHFASMSAALEYKRIWEWLEGHISDRK